MSLPCALALAAVVLTATQTWAQPSPPREPRQRAVSVTGDPAEPPVLIHAAQGVATVLVFKARINGAAVEVDKEQVKILDAGDWTVTFEPLVEPGGDQGTLLSVPFVDGKDAARAVFTLVSSPSQVDTRLDVTRAAPSGEGCQAALAEARARCSKSSPIGSLRDGWLDKAGVVAKRIQRSPQAKGPPGVRCHAGTVYHGGQWVLVDADFSNPAGQAVWVPREVSLKSAKTGASLKLRAVEWESMRIAPGATGRLFVEAEPPANEETKFILEVRDAAGRSLVVDGLDLSKKESKP